MAVIYMPQGKRARMGIIGAGVLIIFLAILIPSVTLRSAPEPDTSNEASFNPQIAFAPDPANLAKVKEALKETPLIDSHNDLPWQFYKLAGNHMYKLDISQDLGNKTHTDIPRMRRGSMGGQFFAAYGPCSSEYRDAVEVGMMQVDTIRRMALLYPNDFQMAGTADEVVQVHRDGKMAILIGLEGGHMINSNLAMLRLYYDLGVRYMTLTHNCHTPWADAAVGDTPDPDTKHDDKIVEKQVGGLNQFGKTVIMEMNRLGMMVDISHVTEQVMVDALEASRAPVIFSHSSAYGLCPHRRNVKDHVLKKLKENGGVLMLNFWSKVLVCSENYKEANMSNVIDQLNYVRDLIGVEHLGMGADYDGVGDVPIGLEDVTTYPNLFAKLLEDPRWSIDDIKKIAGDNILRVMREVEKTKKAMETVEPLDDTILFRDQALVVTNCSCKTIQDLTKEEELEL